MGTAELYAELYDRLRRIAERELRRGGNQRSLSPTTLLHEAYLNFAHRDGLAFQDRSQFIGYASRVMRGLLVDFARSRQTLKRGAAVEIVAMPTQIPEQIDNCMELQNLADAMAELEATDPDLAQVVDLKYFCGFSFVEIAAMRGTNERTVRRAWEKARILLHRALTHGPAPTTGA